MTINLGTVPIGTTLTLTCVFQSEDGVPGVPTTATCTIKAPVSGDVTILHYPTPADITFTAEKVAHARFAFAEKGPWLIRWQSTGDPAASSFDCVLTVVGSALYPPPP